MADLQPRTLTMLYVMTQAGPVSVPTTPIATLCRGDYLSLAVPCFVAQDVAEQIDVIGRELAPATVDYWSDLVHERDEEIAALRHRLARRKLRRKTAELRSRRAR